MIKRTVLVACLMITAFFAASAVPVKADTTTAKNMIPVLRMMYHVDEAEVILQNKVAELSAARKSKAPDYQIAMAQVAVNDATNLVNTLNLMVSRDATLVQAAPAGVVNTPSFGVNSLMAQGAWNDFIYKERTGHVIMFPVSRVPTSAEVSRASKPFGMY